MFRIAQLPRYGPLAASTRQRFDQYRPYLAEVGCETLSWPLFDDRYLRRLFCQSRRSPLQVFGNYLQRLRHLLFARHIDLLWVYGEVFPFLPGVCESLVRVPGRPIVLDLDDAIFHLYDSPAQPLVRAFLGKKLAPLLRAAEIVLCGNEYLASYARQFCTTTMIVPTVLNTDRYRPKDGPRRPGPLRIGWIGSPTTWDEYMAPMLPLLTEIAAAHDARIIVVGAGPKAMPHPRCDLLPWSEATEIACLQDMDLGIMPLSDTPWARGKCGYKLIQYMACGLPVVASPVGVNARLVDHGGNGLLATTEAEWQEALERLLHDPGLRVRMGKAGRRLIEREYSIQVWGPRVAGLLRDIAARRRPG